MLSFSNTVLSNSCTLVICLFISSLLSSKAFSVAAFSFFSYISSSSNSFFFSSKASTSLFLSAQTSSSFPSKFALSLPSCSNKSATLCCKASLDSASVLSVLSRLWIDKPCCSLSRLFSSRRFIKSFSIFASLAANCWVVAFKFSSALLTLSDASSKSLTRTSIFSSYMCTTACFAASRFLTVICNFSLSPKASSNFFFRDSFSVSKVRRLCWCSFSLSSIRANKCWTSSLKFFIFSSCVSTTFLMSSSLFSPTLWSSSCNLVTSRFVPLSSVSKDSTFSLYSLTDCSLSFSFSSSFVWLFTSSLFSAFDIISSRSLTFFSYSFTFSSSLAALANSSSMLINLSSISFSRSISSVNTSHSSCEELSFLPRSSLNFIRSFILVFSATRSSYNTLSFPSYSSLSFCLFADDSLDSCSLFLAICSSSSAFKFSSSFSCWLKRTPNLLLPSSSSSCIIRFCSSVSALRPSSSSWYFCFSSSKSRNSVPWEPYSISTSFWRAVISSEELEFISSSSWILVFNLSISSVSFDTSRS